MNHLTASANNPQTANFVYCCPECHALLTQQGDTLVCAQGHGYSQTDGIWQLLTATARQQYADFLKSYYRVREEESWARPEPDSDLGPNAAYYLALPNYDLSGLYNWTWQMHGRNYRTMLSLLPRREGGLSILDLGAGNGWMSRQLAERGHYPLALDINMHKADGLPVCRVYFDRLPVRFSRAEGDFANLPLADSQFDVVIANASLHYASKLPTVLQEVMRVLKDGGLFITLDSPFFESSTAGKAMVAARQQAYRRYRLPTNASGSFFTATNFDAALQQAGFTNIQWRGQFRADAANPRALWRRLKAALSRGPEQPSFPIVLASKGGDA